MAKGPFFITFVRRNELQFFTGSAVLTLKFEPAILRDLEIVNKAAFQRQVEAFVNQQKINPQAFVIVFAEEICFSADLDPKLAEDEKRLAVANFKASVPFEHVESKVFAINIGERLVCFNKDLSETLIQILAAREFRCLDVYPDYILGNFGASGLTVAAAKAMAENIGKSGVRGFLESVVVEPEIQPPVEESFFTKNKRMIILSAIFTGLLVVLLIFLLTR